MAKSQWKTKNAQTITRISNSTEPHVVPSLTSFKIATAMWNNLKGIYSPANQSRQFELEYEIANIIQEYKDKRPWKSNAISYEALT